MPIVEFSERDLLRGKPIEPAWYRVFIEQVDAEGTLSKDQKSTNYEMEGTVKFNGDSGDTTYANYPITWNFNSKAMGFSRGLFEALGVQVQAKERYRLEAAAGREVDIFIENDTYQGRIVNKVNHKYRAPNPAVVAQPKAGEAPTT